MPSMRAPNEPDIRRTCMATLSPPVAFPSMCGIIAVVQRPARRAAPDLAPLLESLAAARQSLRDEAEVVDATGRAATAVEHVDEALRGVPGVRALLADPAAA